MRSGLLALACLPLLLAACTGADPAGIRQAASPPTTEEADPVVLDDIVDLTLYLRSGAGGSAHLEPVTREVAVEEDLPRRALELLLEGPVEGEDGLEAPLPTTTRLRALEVERGTAHVELSAEAVRDADRAGGSPSDEVLALGALANTLTEFPSIDLVELSFRGVGVDGERFWGGWGNPAPLIRDESLIGPAGEGKGPLDLRRFTTETQTTGSGEADPVEISAVRVRDRLTHVRIAVELEPAGDGKEGAKVPRTRARVLGDELVVTVGGVASYSAAFGEHHPLDLTSEAFKELEVTHDGARATLRLRVDDAAERRFWLHTLSSPTRVILDVKK
jgi:hypothetical protein